MKPSTIITKLRALFRDKEFWKYTGQFLLMMVILYVFGLFSMGFESPNFTYAVF